MQVISQNISRIVHPAIAAIYKERDYFQGDAPEDVLVIQTNFHDADDDPATFDALITDLLLDLRNIKARAEETLGPVDRIDIRTL